MQLLFYGYLYCLVIVNGLHFTVIFLLGPSILSFAMFQLWYIMMLAILILCTYCGKDFSRHCKDRVTTCGPNQTINVIQKSDSQSTVDSQLS